MLSCAEDKSLRQEQPTYGMYAISNMGSFCVWCTANGGGKGERGFTLGQGEESRSGRDQGVKSRATDQVGKGQWSGTWGRYGANLRQA